MVTEEELDRVFKALADPTRRAILEALCREPLAVQAIAGRFEQISRPAISKHLRILRQARLVEEEQQGRQRYYHLRDGALEVIAVWLRPFRDQRPQPLSGHGPESAARAPAYRRRRPSSSDDWRVW